MNITPLPSGLPDVLPPLAAQEFRATQALLDRFIAYGYAPVIPPMAEFESSLLAGSGAATANHMFRVMDIVSHQMLALRADMTTQIGRIAAQGLKDAPRPLRLCYAGHTLRTAPEALRIRRQHTQIGIELFGATAVSHEAEIITIAVDALSSLQLGGLSLDLSAPATLDALLSSVADSQHASIKAAVARKDSAALRTLGADIIADIVDTSGPAKSALEALSALVVSCPALVEPVSSLTALCIALEKNGTRLPITVDLLEMRGFGYYTGIAYSLFLTHPATEIGRGGHYVNQDGEDAAGFTLYMDDVLVGLPDTGATLKLAVMHSTPVAEIQAYQRQGFQVILLHDELSVAGARAAGATHIAMNNTISAI